MDFLDPDRDHGDPHEARLVRTAGLSGAVAHGGVCPGEYIPGALRAFCESRFYFGIGGSCLLFPYLE